MSGVYIKGMEMPTTCLSCAFHDCAAGIGDYCTLTKKKQFRFKNRPSYCPLISVPEHGRLIDADKIEYVQSENGCLDDYAYRYDINEMPTIIPADKEGKR